MVIALKLFYYLKNLRTIFLGKVVFILLVYIKSIFYSSFQLKVCSILSMFLNKTEEIKLIRIKNNFKNYSYGKTDEFIYA